MTKIVISGAGLGGLYTANRLINEGVKPENIIIIDPRAGRYTRPGHINHSTFAKVERYTHISTHHSSAHHIKELERRMYERLSLSGVSFREESFIDLQPHTNTQESGVITKDKKGKQHVYPAAYVFDCSGKDAVVAQAVNRHQEKSNQDVVFKSTQLADVNPITDHLVAHVRVSNHISIDDFSFKGNTDPVPMHYKRASPEKNVSTKEELRKMGWNFETFPGFYTYSQSGSDKICLYMESPLNMPEQKQKEWINLVLSINSQGRVNSYMELKPSNTYAYKPRIMQFKSEPHVLNRASFKSSDLPTVIVGFDALKGFDYREASGVDSGIDCFELMLKHIEIQNGNIKNIDLQAIDQNVLNYIHGKYKKDLISRLADRQESINNGYEYFSDIYEKAAAALPESDSAKKKYRDTAAQLANQSAMTLFSSLESRDKDELKSLEALNKCLRMMIRAKTLLPASATQEHHDINIKLQKVIQYLRLEIAALDVAPIQSLEKRQRLDKLCKSIQDNFTQLDGNFAHNTVQKKMTEILERISQNSSGASPLMMTPENPLLGSSLPFLISALSLASSPVPSAPSFFQLRPSTSSAGARSLIQLLLLGSILSGLGEDEEISPSLSLN
ncbi:hypothetical protein [Legionella quinlivanii]|uniref:hypothetical protein n=1 Tax=Legionella quinlivanii TaxID=45073 RepID=UPI0022444934|nr:hypothetical protein [Legionella quinlivanii]MCW8450325.1 hypothetical protein [Legionella quinlivanii]